MSSFPLPLTAMSPSPSSLHPLSSSVSVPGSLVFHKPHNQQSRQYNKGSRGHGWYVKYRRGDGGRHLQGEHYDTERRDELNNKVFSHSSTVKPCKKAYLDVGGEVEGRLIVELLNGVMPTTSDNFLALLGERGEGKNGYINSDVLRIEKNVGVVFGGEEWRCHPDFSSPEGTSYFPDETSLLSCQRGVLVMVTSGMDKNESRFMILTNQSPHLDGRCIGFGRVVGGMDVLDSVSGVFTKRGVPAGELKIVDGGIAA